MEYVCLKTAAGDEIFAALTEFRDPLHRIVEVMYPMVLSRDVDVDEMGRKQKIVKLSPYFPFASDRIFRMNTVHILHVNPLAEPLIKTYKEVVEAYNKLDEQATPSVPTQEATEGDTEAPSAFFIQGNDTIN